MRKIVMAAGLIISLLLIYIAWGTARHSDESPSDTSEQRKESTSGASLAGKGKADRHEKEISAAREAEELAAATDPKSLLVLVNKQYGLPENYKPSDLVYPNVPFTFTEKIDKRKLREEAAKALEQLFAGAREDGISLLGVSAYRSYKTQNNLYDYYVHKDGEQAAETFSAIPGHSEHETGLAIDVTGGDGRCAAEDCFADTKEAKWLADHAPEYGFIIRYPKGKEQITGYKYEPWHIRYVGKKAAKEIKKKGITLEEYLTAIQTAAK